MKVGSAVPEFQHSAWLAAYPTIANRGVTKAELRSTSETSVHRQAMAHVSHADDSASASEWRKTANPARRSTAATHTDTAVRTDDDWICMLKTA